MGRPRLPPGAAKRQTRGVSPPNFPKSYIEVDSPPPHRPGCFGVAPRLLTPAGQKLMLLAKLAYSRRQFSPLRGSASTLSIRTYGRRACCTSYIGRPRLPPGATKRPRPFVTTPAHGFITFRSLLLCRPAQRAQALQIVHRTSYIVHRRR